MAGSATGVVMAKTRGVKRNFTGGEITPSLSSRNDLAKYPTSCAVAFNFITQLHGSARFRPGFEFVGEALGLAVMIPFQFNTDEEDQYQLVFTDLKLQIVQDDGFVVSGPSRVELTTVYTEAELYDIRYAQTGDVVYLVHASHPVQKLTRSSHTSWAITTVTFDTTIDPPTSPTATFVGGTPGTFTQNYLITSVDVNGQESIASVVAAATTAKQSSQWIDDDHIDVAWTAEPDAVSYNIYKEIGGYYGLAGVSDGVTFLDTNFIPDTAFTPPVEYNPLSGTNYPSVVAFHEQRLWFGGSNENPNTFYASQTGDFENFNKSKPLRADDSLEFTLASGKINQIKWMTSFDDLLIGTTGTEFRVFGSTDGAITPLNVTAKPQSAWGSGTLSPIVIGNSVVHAQRQGSTVRDLFYSLEKNGYEGNDLSILANHIFDGYSLISWAFQQTPDSILWAVRSDGALIGMSFLKEHSIWGWHKHTTTGFVKAVSVISDDDEDRVYITVQRFINSSVVRYIERLATKWRAFDKLDNAFFVDSGVKKYNILKFSVVAGLDHLEGETVVGLLDGTVLTEELVVSGGQVRLPYAVNTAILGLPYSGAIAPMPFEAEADGGSTQGLVRGFGDIQIRLHESMGGKVAVGEYHHSDERTGLVIDLTPEVALKQLLDSFVYDPIEYYHATMGVIFPYTGIKQVNSTGGYEPDNTIFVAQDKPWPLTVQAVMAEVDFG
jgi:hypothetical protein